MTSRFRARLDRLQALAAHVAARPAVVFFDALAGESPEAAARGEVGPVACIPRTAPADTWEAATVAGQLRLAALAPRAVAGEAVTVAGPFG